MTDELYSLFFIITSFVDVLFKIGIITLAILFLRGLNE